MNEKPFRSTPVDRVILGLIYESLIMNKKWLMRIETNRGEKIYVFATTAEDAIHNTEVELGNKKDWTYLMVKKNYV